MENPLNLVSLEDDTKYSHPPLCVQMKKKSCFIQKITPKNSILLNKGEYFNDLK